jgi:c-di-GMP-binding flagellar brake protein YcgR
MQGKLKERRHAFRTDLKQVVRIRPLDPQFPPEYCTTFNISETGLYFATSARHYIPGMDVHVTRDFQPGSPMNRSVAGSVVRVEELENNQFGIAIQVLPDR